MRINRRLMLLVAVPLAVAVTFSMLALAPATSQVIRAHRLVAMVDAAAAAAELTHRLQRERAAATALVAGQGDRVAFQETVAATDTAVTRFREQRSRLSSVPGNARAALDRADRSIEELPSLRAQARSGSSTLSTLAFGYRIVIADLIDYRDGIAQADGVEANVADRIRAAAALSEAAEHIGQQQVTVMRVLAGGGFTPASQRTFEATRIGYTDATGTLFALGPAQWRTWLERTLSGPKALAAQRFEDEVGRSTPGRKLTVPPGRWQEATTDRLALLRSVERRVDDSVLATVTASRTSLTWWAGIEMALVLLTLVGAIFVAARLGRVMVKRLWNLRNAAHDVAYKRLPQVMMELSQPGALDGATPEQFAERSGSPVSTIGQDEIGEVGEAFNSLHHEAVRLAAQQAHSREQFAETLVGVARRGAQMTKVMVAELDAVQRDEADPERMKSLFALDHLAIRMERNTNSLLVLGGYGQGRARAADVPCHAVIMAAAQQIEDFDRVSLGLVEPGIGIAARAVNDLAHLLAELLDNATRFSPPEKQVGVAVWRLTDRAVVQVVDEGVGISPERRAEINALLAKPRTDIGAVRSMGLHVVARLAARYGIVVELRDSEGPGTIAEVTLPSNVLASLPTEVDQRPQEIPGKRPGSGPESLRVVGPRGRTRDRANSRTDDAPPSRRTRDEERQHGAPQPPPPAEAADRVAGVSSAGLPLRKRRPTEQRPGGGVRDGAERRTASAPKSPPRVRDSRQISDVLAAYTRGIDRSASRRGRSTASGPNRSSHDDDTQRST